MQVLALSQSCGAAAAAPRRKIWSKAGFAALEPGRRLSLPDPRDRTFCLLQQIEDNERRDCCGDRARQ